ncbi:glycosyltransferase [Candidatus Woesearchaeota archaeon]|nr:glycosyltransferase [Candidatus Woesearchaeota archaeon]
MAKTKIPKVSIIIPSYNYNWCITEAIESVIRQTYSDWELIIVDDGSKDNSVQIIEKYLTNSKIKLIKHKKNRGLSESYQTGLKNSKGKYIAFLESDDVWHKKSLEIKVKIIEKSKANLVYTDVKFFGFKDLRYFTNKLHFDKIKSEIPINTNFIPRIFLLKNIIPTFSCVIIKKNIFKKLNFNIPVSNPQGLDWWFWLQTFLMNSKIHFIPKKLTKWRFHKTSYSAKTNIPSPKMISNSISFNREFLTLIKNSKVGISLKKQYSNVLKKQNKELIIFRKKIIKIEKVFFFIPNILIEKSIYLLWFLKQLLMESFKRNKLKKEKK